MNNEYVNVRCLCKVFRYWFVNNDSSWQVQVGLFRDDMLSPSESCPFEKLSFKRPREIENNSVKRRKYSCYSVSEKSSSESHNPRYKLQRSISDTAAFSLASAMHKCKIGGIIYIS